MNRIVKRALLGVLVGGGIALCSTVAAQAAETSGDGGTASGTQALIDVNLPITLSGNGISVLGDSSSTAPTTSSPAPASASHASTGGSGGTASGTQGVVSVKAPVTVSGNAVSVVGKSDTKDAVTAAAPAGSTDRGSATTSGTGGTASGTQVDAPVSAPVTVSGNAISLLGDSTTKDAETRAGTATDGPAGAGATTDGGSGLASGTQVVAPISTPITAGGNAISLLGDSTSQGAVTGTRAAGPGGTAPTTDGSDGLAAGTQAVAPVAAPITIGGNAISAVGDSATRGATTGSPAGGVTTPGGATTTGNGGLLSGTQLATPLSVPLAVGGNAVSVVGDATTGAATTTNPGTNPGTTDPGTNPGSTNPGTSAPGVAADVSGVPASVGTVRLATTGGNDASGALGLAGVLLAVGLLALGGRCVELRLNRGGH